MTGRAYRKWKLRGKLPCGTRDVACEAARFGTPSDWADSAVRQADHRPADGVSSVQEQPAAASHLGVALGNHARACSMSISSHITSMGISMSPSGTSTCSRTGGTGK